MNFLFVLQCLRNHISGTTCSTNYLTRKWPLPLNLKSTLNLKHLTSCLDISFHKTQYFNKPIHAITADFKPLSQVQTFFERGRDFTPFFVDHFYIICSYSLRYPIGIIAEYCWKLLSTLLSTAEYCWVLLSTELFNLLHLPTTQYLTHWGKNPIFVHNFPFLIFQKGEFCENWYLSDVNFVKNEIVEMCTID